MNLHLAQTVVLSRCHGLPAAEASQNLHQQDSQVHSNRSDEMDMQHLNAVTFDHFIQN